MLLLTKVAKFLEKTLSLVSYRVSNLGQIVLMAMVLLVVADVVLRRALNSPLSFSFELIEVMLVVAVFFAVAYTGSQRGHASIDLLVSRFPQKARAIIHVFIYLISVGIYSLIAWRTFLHGIHIEDIGQATALLGIPYYPFVFVVAFGTILLVLVLLAQLLYYIIDVVRK